MDALEEKSTSLVQNLAAEPLCLALLKRVLG